MMSDDLPLTLAYIAGLLVAIAFGYRMGWRDGKIDAYAHALRLVRRELAEPLP
jgi:hypothetical protein